MVLSSQTHDMMFGRRAAQEMKENNPFLSTMPTFTIQTLCFTGRSDAGQTMRGYTHPVHLANR